MDDKKCTVCNIKIDEYNYKKDRNICRNCYNINRKKYNKNNKEKIQVVDSVNKTKIVNDNNNKNRTLIIGFSNCGKTYLMNHILLKKQEPIFIITKSLNQYPDIKAQTSDEIQTLENYENSVVVFDDMLLSKQEVILICFLLGVDIIILIFTIFPKAIFTYQKILFVITLT